MAQIGGGGGGGGDLSVVKLELLDASNAVSQTWMLNCNHVHSDITREPVVFSIPSVLTDKSNLYNNRPIAMALDFSMLNEMKMLAGTCKDNEDDHTKPSIAQLRELVRVSGFSVGSPVDTKTLGISGGVRLTINEGPGQGTFAYQGVILNFTDDRDGGNTFWDWKLTVQVAIWPLGMTP